jgi:IS605 OrfB family transposase
MWEAARLSAVATLDNRAQFYSGKEIRSKADHYTRLQKRLQRKGTRSATRRRIALGQRERRLKLNTNHTISKRILATMPSAFIGLEELTGIRERTSRRKGNQLLPVSKQARRAHRHASTWAFAELQELLAYKAALAGSLCIKVDADYTSQACPRCGFTSRANRPQQGLLFVCQQCHYRLHADLVGARNIARRHAGHTARLDGHGAVVRCPRGIRPRSQSGTAASVCRSAVESGHKPPALAVGCSDNGGGWCLRQALRISQDVHRPCSHHTRGLQARS